MTSAARKRTGGADWSARRERGSAALVRVMAWLSLSLGWHAARLLLGPAALYFLLSTPPARANSRAFLRRALGRDPGWRERFRHFLAFANVLLDRVYLLAGRDAAYRVEIHGLEALTEALAAAEGRGCLLLGSHLGSFEVLRAFGRTAPVPVRGTMYRANAGAFTSLLERLDPTLLRNTIEIGTPDAMLRVQEALARGELVGFLADRLPDGARRRAARVDFLGAPALFPTAPLLLAARLGVPAVQFFGIRTAPRTYRIEFAPLALAQAPADVAGGVARYVRALELRCRLHPFNWFNFHDFWHDPAGGAASAAGVGIARPSRPCPGAPR